MIVSIMLQYLVRVSCAFFYCCLYFKGTVLVLTFIPPNRGTCTVLQYTEADDSTKYSISATHSGFRLVEVHLRSASSNSVSLLRKHA